MHRRQYDRVGLGYDRVGLAAAVAAMVVLETPATAQTAGGVALAGHRAVYDLSLAQSRGKQSLESVRGRILYDFSASRCEGYALNFRQVTELHPGEGKPEVVSDLRTTNWEDAAGTRYNFNNQNFINGSEVDAAEGRAVREGDAVAVTVAKPAPRTMQIGDVVFPSDHMKRVIAAAQAGQSVLEIATFDGSDKGEKVYNSMAVIGQAIGPGAAPADDPAVDLPALTALKRWPVTISYFDRSKAGGEQMPTYAISFEIYENGIARAVRLDYGDFVLDGRLSSLELKEAAACP